MPAARTSLTKRKGGSGGTLGAVQCYLDAEMRVRERKWRDHSTDATIARAWRDIAGDLARACSRELCLAEARLRVCVAAVARATGVAGEDELHEAKARVRRTRADLERAVHAESYDDVVKMYRDCQALRADVLGLRQRMLLDITARELVESKRGEFVCPIGRELMLDPVVAADGHTYERRNIEKHFESQGQCPVCAPTHIAKSPMTNLPLSTLRLVPNVTLRGMILEEVDAAKLSLQRALERRCERAEAERLFLSKFSP